MTKSQYLYRSKAFLRKVVKSRKWLMVNNVSHTPSIFSKTEIANIEKALHTIVSAEKMQKYLDRKESVIKLLIPANKKIWFDEFRELKSYNPIDLKLEFSI